MIIRYQQNDFKEVYNIINDAASAYKGVIPADRWHEPYLSEEELKREINDGVEFWLYAEDETIHGIMGIQYKGDVTLIRHAYVRTTKRNTGIGRKLLSHLCSISSTPILIGTWADATWAISFYQRNGFTLLSDEEKTSLLQQYWSVPKRQMETSVVLASSDWFAKKKRP